MRALNGVLVLLLGSAAAFTPVASFSSVHNVGTVAHDSEWKTVLRASENQRNGPRNESKSKLSQFLPLRSRRASSSRAAIKQLCKIATVAGAVALATTCIPSPAAAYVTTANHNTLAWQNSVAAPTRALTIDRALKIAAVTYAALAASAISASNSIATAAGSMDVAAAIASVCRVMNVARDGALKACSSISATAASIDITPAVAVAGRVANVARDGAVSACGSIAAAVAAIDTTPAVAVAGRVTNVARDGAAKACSSIAAAAAAVDIAPAVAGAGRVSKIARVAYGAVAAAVGTATATVGTASATVAGATGISTGFAFVALSIVAGVSLEYVVGVTVPKLRKDKAVANPPKVVTSNRPTAQKVVIANKPKPREMVLPDTTAATEALVKEAKTTEVTGKYTEGWATYLNCDIFSK